MKNVDLLSQVLFLLTLTTQLSFGSVSNSTTGYSEESSENAVAAEVEISDKGRLETEHIAAAAEEEEECSNPSLKRKFLEMIFRMSIDDANSHGESFADANTRNNAGTFSERLLHPCGPKFARFVPMVHIVNASMFLASHQDSKQQQQQQKNGSAEAADGDAGSSSSNTNEDWCMLVNFYASHCPFSTRLAPNYNALPRAFPTLFVAAIDATQNAKLNLIYGISGTPTLLLFHNGRPVARYDSGGYQIKSLAEFVMKHTDLEPQSEFTLQSEDYDGPLKTELDDSVDYYLLFAWYFVALCSAYYFCDSSLARRLLDTLRRNWREMNEE